MPRNPVLWGSAGLAVAALALALRYNLSQNTLLISDLSSVGRAVGKEETNGLDDEYDVIIVGGGTAGCVLASRLSEDPSIRVLLLEAGGSGKALSLSRIPSGFGGLYWSPYVYNMNLEPQVYARGKENYFPRGKMLGGCSSINAQMAQYGSPTDFDEWARITGDESWSWKEFSRYIRKFENYTFDASYPQVDVSARGTDGPVKVGYFNTVSRASKEFIKSCVNVGIPFTADFNGPNGTRGVSRIMTYVDSKGHRVSAETAYLTKEVLARPNLKVAIHAQVTQILTSHVDGRIHAVGVEFANTESGPRYRVRARKEVILSAGAVHSPQILMLSGVGPAEQLQRHNLPVIHDLPGVGSHLIDHPVVDVYLKDKLGVSAKFLKPTNTSEKLQLLRATAQWMMFGNGPLATNFGESAAFVRTDDPVLFPPSQYPKALVDSTSGTDGPDLELFSTPMAYKEHGAIGFDVHTFALHVYLVRPLSTGTVELRSANPWENPKVNPNYCKNPDDLEKLVRGMKLCLKIAQTDPLASLLDQNDKRSDLDHEMHLKTDAELAEVVKDRVETVYHPTSTCRMTSLEDGGVVDSQMRVYGISNLRVCDASIFPSIISGHTAGACLAAAEKLSDMLKKEIGGCSSGEKFL